MIFSILNMNWLPKHLLPSVETLCGGLPRWSDGDDGLPTLDAHHAVGYPFSGLDKVGSTWILPVNPAYGCVPTWKGEYFGRYIVKE